MITRTHPGGLPPLAPVPTGAIVAVSRGAAGSRVGFLRCDGSYVSKDTYRGLFNLVLHTFSGGTDPGDGTFRLPLLASHHVVGGTVGQIATNAGAANHSHTWSSAASIQPQTDTAGLYPGTHNHDYGTSPPPASGPGYNANYFFAYHGHSISGNTGASTGTGLIDRATGNVDTPIGSHSHTFSQNTDSGGSHTHGWTFNHSGTVHSHSASLTQDTRTGANALTGSNQLPDHPVVYLIKT